MGGAQNGRARRTPASSLHAIESSDRPWRSLFLDVVCVSECCGLLGRHSGPTQADAAATAQSIFSCRLYQMLQGTATEKRRSQPGCLTRGSDLV